MRPRGMPPTPMAASRLMAPVGIASTRTLLSAPSRMIEPLPQLFSICAMARFSAFFLSSAIEETAIVVIHPVVERSQFWPGRLSHDPETGVRGNPKKIRKAQTLSSGSSEAESVLDVADPDVGAIHEQANHIAPVVLRSPSEPVDPHLG